MNFSLTSGKNKLPEQNKKKKNQTWIIEKREDGEGRGRKGGGEREEEKEE